MPSTSYQLAEVKDNSDGQFHSAAICHKTPEVFAIGGDRDVQVYQVVAELSGKFKGKVLVEILARYPLSCSTKSGEFSTKLALFYCQTPSATSRP